MNLIGTMAAVLLGTCLAGTAHAADFTVEELHKSSLEATKVFLNDYGTDLHDAIYGIQVTKGRESGKVKLFYKQNDLPKSIEYFCHYHSPETLDCHEH